MVEAFVTRDATADQLIAWSETVERFVDGLEGAPPGSVFWGISNRGYFSVRGLLEPPNFVPPPSQAGDGLTGTVVFGEEQAGHRGFAHGGSIAQAFDYLLSVLDFAAEADTFTRELSVRFLKPIPIGQPVALETAVEARDARSATVSGRAVLAGTVHAEATAVLVFKQRPG
jgi:acyl-coenzyme A thioesterase PaaI-like protein